MQIFADQDLKGGLEKLLTPVCGNQECYIVQLEQKTSAHMMTRQSLAGLDIGLEIAKEGIPVIILGFLSHEMIVTGSKSVQWFAAMGHPNIEFCRLPATSAEVLLAIAKIQSGDSWTDPLAIALLGVKQNRYLVGQLRHDISYALRNAEVMERWVNNARKLFGEAKTQAELLVLAEVAEATKWDTQLQEDQLAGQVFPDVCVDVEGTLLDADGNLREAVIALVLAKANGGPITVWTGGDVELLTTKLRDVGVYWKIVSKYAMRGTAVQVIIDDQPEAVFVSEYGITCQEYIQV